MCLVYFGAGFGRRGMREEEEWRHISASTLTLDKLEKRRNDKEEED
jgi:hypothetical protein